MCFRDSKTRVFRWVAASLFGLSLGSTDALAQSADNPNFHDLSRQSTEIGWLPGEQYDPRTGHLNHVMTDLEFEGNGLPIRLTRQVIQGSEQGIKFAFPTLTLDNKTTNDAPTRCGRGTYPSSIDFDDASTKQVFIRKNLVNSNLTHYPSNAIFVSKDDWIIKCNGGFQFVVVSPDGMSYTFSRSLGGSNEKQFVYLVSDVHGNELEYSYAGYKPYSRTSDGYRIGEITGVSKIVASDGREVTLTYGETEQARIPSYYMSSKGIDYVRRIRTNGAPNAREINYNITSSGYSVNHGLGRVYRYSFHYRKPSASKTYMRTNLLSSVTYPTGGKVQYSYPSFAKNIIHDTSLSRAYHFELASRTVSGTNIQSGTTTFESQTSLTSTNSAYARIIKTPSSTLEYRYRKEILSANANLADEGKLIATKIFPNIISHWDEYEPALIEKQFEYEISVEFVGGDYYTNFQSYRKAELTKEKTRLNNMSVSDQNRVLTNNPLDYTTEYSYHNDGLNPEYRLRNKKEISPAGSSRTTNYTYKTISTDSIWVAGLPNTISASSGDLSSFKYTYKGSLESETHNHIKTSYLYHSADGNLRSRTTDRKTYSYDSYYRGIPKLETDEADRKMEREVNSDGTISKESVWNQPWSNYSYSYDQLHRLTQTVYPNNIRRPTYISYRSENETYITNPGGGDASTTTLVDGFGRPIMEKNLSQISGTPTSQRITATKYDSEGRVLKTIYPTKIGLTYAAGLTSLPGINYEYDGLGRKIKTIETLNLNNGAQRIRKWNYTNVGKRERIQYIDSRNARQNLYFHSYGSPKQEYLVMMIDGNGVRTDYRRDTAGRLTSMTRENKERRYQYNWRKELKSEYHPESGETSYTYHPDGLLKTQSNNGRTASYTYYEDNQLNETSWSDGASLVTLRRYYDGQGRLQSADRTMNDSNLSVFSSYGYDSMGNLLFEKNEDNLGVSLQMSYDYDERANLKRITYPNGKSYDLKPNAYGELTKILGTDGKTIVSNVLHDPDGGYNRIDSGKSSLRSTQDHLFQTRNRRHFKNGNRDTYYIYSYDSESNMSYLKNHAINKDQRMYYDNANRLTKVSGSRLGTRLFNYNSRDDITSKKVNGVEFTYNYDWRGWLKDITSQYPKRNFSYNDQGEVTKLDTYRSNTPNSLRQLTMTRDSEGRLSATSDGTKYGYDHRGLRFFKEKNGRIYSYYDVAGKLRYRWDRAAGVKTEYHYVGNELTAKREIYAGSDNPAPPPGESPSPGESPLGPRYWVIEDDTLTIRWIHSAWHQVQHENGDDLKNPCNGGSSCTVPSPGRYKFTRHGDDSNSDIVTIGSASSVTTDGDYTINHSTRTISWSISGWHQIQTENGQPLTPKCDGGNSCTVSSNGKYLIVNHGKPWTDPNHRKTVTVGQ